MGSESYERSKTIIMSDEIIERIYLRMKDYCLIKELAVDTPKIANLANDEILKSFVEGVYKFSGSEKFLDLLKQESNEVFKLMIATLLLGFNKQSSKDIIANLKKSKNSRVSESADNIISERYSTINELIENYSSTLKKYIDKLNLPNT